jgi:uncharacterized LabA/DUF88 family protein
VDTDEERIALFLDYENLAIGARENLHGLQFDLRPVLDALAERGRVIARKAYADWSYFDEDRRMLTRSQVELIEIPQRMRTSRKNAADIKLAVDALEMAFEREYVTTFVICTGDSDLTPLVHKLRELNKRVVGVGVKESTSALLPPACDEFLFYEALEGVDVPPSASKKKAKEPVDRSDEPAPPIDEPEAAPRDVHQLSILIAQTVAGLERTSGGAVLASSVKRALLRKDPTFSEADYGFRAFGELMQHLADANVVELAEGSAKGDPQVALPSRGGETEAFELLRSVVADLQAKGGPPALSGLKNQVRKVQPDFSEKKYGYRGFLQFCRAADTKGFVSLEWNDDAEDYLLEAD